jgi:hypothetical protein
MGRTAHATVRFHVDHLSMDRGIVHRIEDDLTETWVEVSSERGVRELEGYLAKHLAFLSFLDVDEAPSA